MSRAHRILLVLIICPFLTFSQGNQSAGRLYSKLQDAKQAGTFPRFNVFSKSSEQLPITEQTVKEAVFLNLNQTELGQLRRSAPQNISFIVPAPDGQGFWELELEKATITTSDFVVNTPQGKVAYNPGIHYRGIFNNNPSSMANISVFDDELIGMLADNSGSYDLGVYGEVKSTSYVLYRSNELNQKIPFDCRSDEAPAQTNEVPQTAALGQCNVVRIYFEADFKLYTDKGSNTTNVTNYITGLFNQVALAYSNEDVIVAISEIYIWTTTDPFIALGSSSNILSSFRATRTTFNGNIAHLLSTRPNNLGGIAYLDVLCATSYAHAFSNISNSYSNWPTYSWTVMVVTHETGHNLGSNHTQWCYWPGGALDNCYTPEGSCAAGPAPVNGGTIMSYCHIVSGVGINLNNGFGQQPGDKIRLEVYNAACLTASLTINVTAAASTNLCQGSAVTLNASGGSTYTWSPPTGLNTTSGASVIAIPAATTTYTATSSNGTCTGSDAITITVLPGVNFGIIAEGDQVFTNNGNPSTINLSTPASGGAGTFTYQWYSKAGISADPTGTSTTGWTAISGATSSSYDPPTQTASVTFALQAQPTGTPDCGNATWTSSVRLVTITGSVFNPGTVATGNQSFCSTGGDPTAISFAVSPSGAASYVYQWYFKNGIVVAPGGSSVSGWTIITGATGVNYDAPAGLTASRTFACFVTPSGDIGQWASGARQITILPAFNPGTVLAADETLCNPADPSNITFSTLPSGSGSFTYQWYFKNSLSSCPTGSSTTGWTIISGATTTSFNPAAGATTLSRTFAVMVTPTGSTSCGTAQWANNCRKITVPAAVNYGTLAPGNQTIDFGGDPAAISFSVVPSGSGSFNYQWYYKDGIAAAPTGTSTTGWTAAQGILTTGLFDPGALAASRTYACYVIPAGTPTCGNARWASGARQITVNAGTIVTGTLVSGNQTFCNSGGDPVAITFSATPTGLTDPIFTYQWYYMNGIPANAPTGSSATGWTIIPNATSSSYDPGAVAVTRTYGCLVGAAGIVPTWASGTRQITILPAFNPGTVTNANQTFCNSGNPANITLSPNPAGSGAYSWRWYFKESSAAACPSGSSTTGWLTNSTSPNITGTTFTGAGVSFDPVSAGASGAGRTFAVLITPIANGTTPACGTPQWAASCRKLFVNSCLPGEMPDESEPASATEEEQPALGQSYPNPTAGNITISYNLPSKFSNGTISFYDINGKMMRSVRVNQGNTLISFDCSEMPSGTYFYSLESSGMKIATKKLVVIK